MKRMNHMQIHREAEKIFKDWVGRYSLKNANKISLAVRRLFRKEATQCQS